MKKIHNYILLIVCALMVVCCSNEELDMPKEPSKASDEVQFGLSLDKLSRTVYGQESDNAFPIYWKNGDKVKVASPQCAANRNNAEYEVSVAQDGAQDYADALTKTQDYGVQWGDVMTGNQVDFYSIYPSEGTTLTVDPTKKTVTANLVVAATQYANYTSDSENKIYYAQPAQMGNVIMAAKQTITKKVNDDVVNLQYDPLSTVIEFELNAPKQQQANKQTEITIQSIKLIAPTGTTIAGNFTYDFNGKVSPVESETTTISESVTLHFLHNNVYDMKLSVTGMHTLKAKMCLMPMAGTNFSKWTVEVSTSAGLFSKELTATSGNLASGKVHKIKLPTLDYSSAEWTYNKANWITSLPDYKNIYLTEISLPGAWYAGDEAYQATKNFDTYWSEGIRAFAVECRCYTPRTGIVGGGDITKNKPTRICLSGGGSEKNGAYTHQWAQENKLTYLSDVIQTLANKVAGTAEFAVLTLDYAYGSSGGYRALDYENFLTLVQTDITSAGVKNVVSEISSNTIVDDVLGQLIIKVNVDNRVNFVASDINALFSAVPLISDLDVTKVYYSDIIKKSWTKDNYSYIENPTIDNNDFLWCFSSANRTQPDPKEGETAVANVPTYQDRKNALNAMIVKSKSIYKNSNHNVWFYFNAGGTEADLDDDGSPTAFAENMNSWLLEQINAKTDASPLGIVMFNQCTSDTYKGPSIVEAIIEMNSKFYLKHAGDEGAGTGGNQGTTTQTTEVKSAASGYSMGVKDEGKSAF